VCLPCFQNERGSAVDRSTSMACLYAATLRSRGKANLGRIVSYQAAILKFIHAVFSNVVPSALLHPLLCPPSSCYITINRIIQSRTESLVTENAYCTHHNRSLDLACYPFSGYDCTHALLSVVRSLRACIFPALRMPQIAYKRITFMLHNTCAANQRPMVREPGCLQDSKATALRLHYSRDKIAPC
jgi:hypothetical protein